MTFGQFRHVASCLFLAVAVTAPAHAAGDWPTIPLPKESTAYPVDDTIVTNGVPMQVTAFTSPQSQEKLLAWFRKKFEGHRVENRVGQKIVLGQARGEHYLTVQIEPTRDGSRGVAAVSHLKAAYDQREKTRAGRDRWLRQLPSGSRIISETASVNPRRHSEQRVYANAHSASVNRDALREILGRDGLILERESRVDNATAHATETLPTDARTLYFKGAQGEAIATISHDDKRRTVVVLNTITEKGKPR